MKAGLPIVMPHENDPNQGGCPFERFFTTTPPDIIAAGIYKQLAFACYPGVLDRRVSLALIAKMGLGFQAKRLGNQTPRAGHPNIWQAAYFEMAGRPPDRRFDL